MFYAQSSGTEIPPGVDRDDCSFDGFRYEMFRTELVTAGRRASSVCNGGVGEAWAADRRDGMGASQVATACGMNPYEKAETLFYRRVGRLPRLGIPMINNKRGHQLEPWIHKVYEMATGLVPVEIGSMHTYDERYPWASCSCDGIVPMGSSGAIDSRTHDDIWPPITELKAPRSRSLGIRSYYAVQMLWQLAVTGAPYVDFIQVNQAHEDCPPWKGGLVLDCPIIRVYRNEAMQEQLLARCKIFVDAVNHAHIDYEGSLARVRELTEWAPEGSLKILPLRHMMAYGELVTEFPVPNRQHFRVDRWVLDTWDDREPEFLTFDQFKTWKV